MSVLVTHLAPDFTKPAVLPDGTFNDAFNFHTEISGKYAVLFFYPLDFTFVCPSEIIAHSHRAEPQGARVGQPDYDRRKRFGRRVCIPPPKLVVEAGRDRQHRRQ